MPARLLWTWKVRLIIVAAYFFIFFILKKARITYLLLCLAGIYVTMSLISLANGELSWGILIEKDLKICLIEIAFFALFSIIICSSVFNGKRGILHLYVIFNFTALGIIMSLIAFQQFFDLFNLNSFYIAKLAPPDSVHTNAFLSSVFPRVIGTIGNPNEFGFQLALCSSSALFGFFNYKKPFYLFSFLFISTSLCLTASRTSIVMLLSTIFIIVGFSENRKLRLTFFLVLFFQILFMGYFANKIGVEFRHLDRILAIANISEDKSWKSRKDLYWEFNLDWFLKAPLLGVGPLSEQPQVASDNEWLLLLRRRGIVGVSFMILFFIASLKNKKNNIFISRWGSS